MRNPEEVPTTSDAGFSGEELSHLYQRRFSVEELEGKRLLWWILCREYLDQYIRATDTVVDLGAGSCEFINAVRAGRKIAVDVNPDTKKYAIDAEVLLTSSDDMSAIPTATVDVVFTSNFFEHLPDKRALLRTLEECARILRSGGSLLILMPNLRYLHGRYWDYFDHHLPLTHLSLAEGLRLAGFTPEIVIPRFLPYTVKDFPVKIRPFMVKAYLRMRFLWPLLGRQMFILARR